MGALGASSGALLGGVLTQAFGWQAIFAVNIPLGAVVVGLGRLAIPSIAPVQTATRHFDALGATLVTTGLIALTFGIVRTDTLGWGSVGVLVPLAAGVALLAAFIYVEARVAPAPLVPLSIFRIGRLRAANLIVVLLYAANFPAFFFVTIYLQQVLHYSAIGAGLAFLPWTLGIFTGSTLAPRAVARFGARRVITTAMLAMGVGMALFSGIAPGQTYVGSVLLGAVLSALGMGFTLVPSTIVAMQGVPGAQSGVASGLLNTSRLMGGALGLAILSTIASGRTRGEVGIAAGRALTDGFDLAFIVAVGFAVVGALVAIYGLRPAKDVADVVSLRESAEAEEQPAVAA
jgi:MFS family permease